METRALHSSHRALARLCALQARLRQGDHGDSPQQLQFFDRHHPAPHELLIQTVAAARRCESQPGWEGPIQESAGRAALLEDVEHWLRHRRDTSDAAAKNQEQKLLGRFPAQLLRCNRRNNHNNGIRTSDKTLAVAYFALGVPEHPKWAIEWFVCDTTSRPSIKILGTESASRLEMLLQPWRAMLVSP